MKTKLKKLSDAKVEVTVALDADDLQPAKQKALTKLAKELKVEGFRKGKVPLEVAQRFIPENDINAETVDFAVRTTIIEAFSQNQKTPLALPEISVTKYVPGESLEYKATADIIPEVKLGNYKKLGVKKTLAKISEKEINGVLDDLANSRAEKKPVKRAAKATDEVIIDFVGKKDGVEFEGGKAKDYRLVLGSGSFIPGFEDGIIGHESGDKFDLKLTFPKDYGVKDLAGAKTVFEVLLKQVNEVTPGKIDDTTAKEFGPFKNLAELKADIKKHLEMRQEAQATEDFKNQLIEALVKKSTIPVPEVLIKDQLRAMRDDVTRNAASQGLSFEELLKRGQMTTEDWEKEAKKAAEQRVKASLALQAVAVEQKISVTDDLVEAKLAELKEIYKKSPEARQNLKNPNVKIDIKNRLIIEATLDYLVKENS